MKIFSNLLFMNGSITQVEQLVQDAAVEMVRIELEASEKLKAEMNKQSDDRDTDQASA
jgi:hypothetical protein